MSVDEIKPKLSKEEKSRRKEAKLRAKEAASGTPSTSIPVPASDESKKDKRDKKRKREANGEGSTSIAPGISHAPVAERREADGTDREERKKKKEGKAKPAEANGTNEPEPTLSDPAGPLSKKQLVKLARTHRTSTSPSTSTSTPTSATPTPQPFTPAHQTYLSTHTITLTPSLFPPHLSIPTLPIHSNIITFLSQFKEPTPIQACSWPPLLAGRDVVGIAETGSGKTLAFGAPGLNSLVSSSPSDDGSIKNGGEGRGKGKGKGKDWISMLVLAPTRELALQSHETLVSLGQGLGIASVCLFGGVGKDEQLGGLRRREVRNVVGTPGRTLDLADAGDLDLSNVRYLVLDEADRMLDQGFENDIRRIIGHCPAKEERQTVMFSATWPESVRRLASTFLRDPIRITVGSDELSANKRIEQVVEVLDHSSQKDARMLHHLKAHLRAHPSSSAAPTRILVFALYKKEAQRLESTIRRAGYNVGALHGDMGQDARFRALDKFKNGSVNVLVATDVAARGLDIPDVGLVLNVTFPLTTEDFVHRTGRTGRAGKSGKAVTFFTGENHERSLAGEFMRVLRDVGAQIPKGMDRFPSTIKRKEHGSYGAFYKDVSDAPAATKITFD